MKAKLKIYCCVDESVIYNVESGNIHLIPSFNVELLSLINRKINKPLLLVKIVDVFNFDQQEAESYLDNLCFEYRKLNLID